MPEKRTLERARRDRREGKSPTTQAGEFVREEIHHVREGKHGARSAKQAIARILKANDVFAYNPASRKTFEQEFRAYELNLKSPLAHEEGKRQGFVIFLAPGKTPVSAPRGLVLTIEGLSQTATLNLN